MPKLTIRYNEAITEYNAQEGENLLDILRGLNIPVDAPCGRGRCGKCRVQLTANGQAKTVLACVTQIKQDCSVEVISSAGGRIAGGEELSGRPSRSDLSGSGRHGRHGHPGRSGRRPYDASSGHPCYGRPEGHSGSRGSEAHTDAAAAYGLAVDLGTTTVVIELYRLFPQDPLPISVISDWNAQLSYGSDVITRVQYIMTHEDGLDVLSRCIRSQIADLSVSLCDQHQIAPADIKQISLAGNTIMQHIFAGIDPSPIAAAPYTPQTLFTDHTPMQFAEFPGVDVTFSPCVSGYVGGDITSGLLSSGLLHHHGCALFLDIGTNGEMALCENGQFLCCSVASGPAFEGAEITCGMRSVPGAVSRITRAGTVFSVDVISDAQPSGICGSGLIDLLAVLLETGIVDETGRLLPPDEVPEAFSSYLTEDENGNGVFHLTDRISFTAADVRKLQLAKAAVAAGIDILLQEAGKTVSDIDTLYLAGGFGTYLDPHSAAAIGMIPAALSVKTRILGNSSLSGMRRCLLRPRLRSELTEIQRNCRYLELSGNGDFNDLFIDHLGFDETDA